MIGFNELGNKGWLGNQMFQYASLLGIARKNGYEFCIPPNDNTRVHDYGLLDIFEMGSCKETAYVNFDTVQVTSFNFDKNFYENCPDNVNINGFFQTEKYFCEFRDEILKNFSFKKKYENPFKDEDYIALHIRRKDYIYYQNHHPVLDISYYERAISEISEKLPVAVFSDDITWCAQNIKSADYFSVGADRDEDMYLMTQAKHNIIANSSFSWWGAWLNQNPDKIVIAPNNWFGSAYSHYDTSDLRPDDWILI